MRLSTDIIEFLDIPLLFLKVMVKASAIFTKGEQVRPETKNKAIPSRWYNSVTHIYMGENHPTRLR